MHFKHAIHTPMFSVAEIIPRQEAVMRDGTSIGEFPMKIVPVICFALATAVAGSMLPVSSSYAATYLTKSQNCAFTGELPTNGVGNCKDNKNNSGSRHDRPAAHSGR